MLQELLDRHAPANSKLSIRCRKNPKFTKWLEQMIVTLREFYSPAPDLFLQTFESRINRWFQNPGNDYMSFVGEMVVAKKLAENHVFHYFIPESEFPTPDIALKIADHELCFEVATIGEDVYYEFGEAVAQKLKAFLPSYRVSIMPLYVKVFDEKSLVELAAQTIQEAILKEKHHTLVEYKGEIGTYSLAFNFDTIIPGEKRAFNSTWRTWWEESRVSKEGIPFIQQKLKLTLKDKQHQFATGKPTFLVWVNFDTSLLDVHLYIRKVLEQDGATDFSNVAGIILDRDKGQILFENEFNTHYISLREDGIFDKIRTLV